MTSVPGGRFGKYDIVKPVGAGGMGVVYQAYDRQLRRMVALKLLATTAESTPRRLLHEARSASGLSHSNICTVYEVGDVNGEAYIAMEYVEGRPLRETIPPGGLPVESVTRTGIQIADALAHAHEHHILHRDLKTSNVMVTPDGKVKVVDFGLAARTGAAGASDMTRSQTAPGGTFGGTLAYMAPEALRLETVDTRSDIWALGVMLHEMAAGALPFVGHSPVDLASAIVREPPRPLPPDVPTSLRSIVQRCMAKDPAHRYQRASEVRAALEMTLVDLGGGAGEIVQPGRCVLQSLSLPAVIALAAVVGIALGFLAIRALQAAVRPRQTRRASKLWPFCRSRTCRENRARIFSPTA